jgi:hypothetical protein
MVSISFEDDDDELLEQFLECLRRLFSNARRDPGVTTKDCAMIYAGLRNQGYCPEPTNLFQDQLWVPVRTSRQRTFWARGHFLNTMFRDFWQSSVKRTNFAPRAA